MVEYTGYTGRVVTEPDQIVIVRDTLASKASHGGVAPWHIPLQAITGVKLDKATRFKNGKLQVLIGTAPPSDGDSNAADTIYFTHKHRGEFAELAEWINQVANVNRESGVDSSQIHMDPPPAAKGVGGLLQSGKAKAQAVVDADHDSKQTDWDARGVIFEGKSHDEGRNATVTLYEDRIERIKERSVMSFSSARQDVEVTPIRSVTSVQAKKDGLLWTKVTIYASGNNIDFRFSHADAHHFRDAITSLILKHGQSSAMFAPPVPIAETDVMDQLKKLGELRDAGIVTPEEFDTKKAELLKRI